MQPWCLLRAAESIETGTEARTSDTEGRQFNSAQGLHPITDYPKMKKSTSYL
jgi:hypothetical protein